MSKNPVSDEVDKAMTSVKDLRLMLKKPINENATPYDRQSIQYSYDLIDEFFKDIVIPHSKNGQINCSFVVDSWKIYQEGKETEIMYSLKEHLHKVSQEQFEYWKAVFELPVEKMLKLGRSTLLYGHETLTMWYRYWLMETKYKQFFSDPDPTKWILKKKDIDHFEVNNIEYCGIDMKKYTEKISCIMRGVPRV